MNRKMIYFILGRMLGVEAVLLCIPGIVGLLYREGETRYFFFTALLLWVIFLLIGRKKPERSTIYAKEGLVIVSCAWILWSVFGALPFYHSGCIPAYIDALFETVSGFTTTGSSILQDIERLPQCMLFWRSFTHWVGGMGVLVFVMVLTSLEQKHAMHLMRAEVPGPEKDKLLPKSRTTAQVLYGMYFALTLIEICFLLAGGMNLFDSLIHAFGTAGTGGFSNYSSSIAHFDSHYIEWVITVFMILFGINFNLYFYLLLRDWKSFYKNEELKVYLGIIGSAIFLITWNIASVCDSIAEAIRYAAFQVGSIITTTGFATTDFNQWPEFSKSMLLLLMIVGACASSTGGGMKVSRIMILWKNILKMIKEMFHFKSVNVVRINGKKVSDATIANVYKYTVVYLMLIILSVLVVSLDNFDFGTSLSAVLATVNNIGPGIEAVGPTGNFSQFSVCSKLVFCLDMLAGRLEIFPFLMLFSFIWRKKF